MHDLSAPNPTFNYIGTYDENDPLPAWLSLAQYRGVIFRPDAHFVDGRIEPRQVGDLTHGLLLTDLIHQLHPACKAVGLACCLSLRLQTSPTRIRVCDFVALCHGAPYEAVPTVAPLLCIEVLSEGEDLARAQLVLADYLAMGVPNLWLIDPLRRVAYTYSPDGLHFADTTNLTVPETPLRLDLTEPFAALD